MNNNCKKIETLKDLDKGCRNDLFALVDSVNLERMEIQISDTEKTTIVAKLNDKIDLGIISTIQKFRIGFDTDWKVLAIRELTDNEKKSIDLSRYEKVEQEVKEDSKLNKNNQKQETKVDNSKTDNSTQTQNTNTNTNTNTKVEKQKLTKIADLKEKEKAILYLRLKEDVREEKTSNNKTYIIGLATDGIDEISIKRWNTTFTDKILEGVDITSGKILKVQGTLDIWEQTKNFMIEKIRNVVPSDNIEEDMFIKCAPHSPLAMYNFIVDVVKKFPDEDYKKIVLYLLEQNKEQILYYPAGKTVHHNEKGGLLYHIFTILKSCMAHVDIYPGIIAHILYTGAILHDIGKIKEMNSDLDGVVDNYSTEGELLGHIALGMEMVSLAGKELNIPREKIMIINHMIASHQPPRLGGLVETRFLEAEILKNIDMIDSRVYMFNEAYRGLEPGEFSDYQKFLNRVRIYNLGGEKSVEKDL